MVASLLANMTFAFKDQIKEMFSNFEHKHPHPPHPHPRPPHPHPRPPHPHPHPPHPHPPHPRPPHPNPEDDKKMNIKLILNWISGLIILILTIFGIFLSFKRNNGFDLGSFLMACCFGPCYVLYALAVPVNPPIITPITM
tara:strand:+ start:2465 stop:2884 length:420 start_codon:yes stop_codon:yes gene_type:complete